MQLTDVVKQCIPFILACYEDKNADSANDARHNQWMMKLSKNVVNAPKR
jgi:hypothetical protein